MAGEFQVDYRYEETVALRPGYELTAPYTAAATELVLIARDTGDHIVLQHLLLIGEPTLVVKHWQQTWVHQPGAAVQLIDVNLWQRRPVGAADQPGMWSRTVTEADDGPAYAAWGRWSHTSGVSTWTSDAPVFAPLPRREADRRADYQALSVEDRITVTPTEWVHEQNLTKCGFAPDAPALTRETGVVRYRPAETSIDFAQARGYWDHATPFWAQVRRAWAARFEDDAPLSLRDQVDGQPRWRRLFALAPAVQTPGSAEPATPTDPAAMRLAIDEVLDVFIMRP